MRRRRLARSTRSIRPLVLALGPFVLAAALAAGASAPASAARSNAFRPMAGGPRAAALGGHLVALVEDDTAVDVNPARLAYVAGSITAEYARLVPDIEVWQGRVGYAQAVGGSVAEPLQRSRPHRAAVGLSLDAVGLSLIEGSAYHEASAGLALGIAPSNLGAFGLGVRVHRAVTDVEGLEARGYGVDLGLSADLTDHLVGALGVRNLAGRAEYEEGESEALPRVLTLGIAMAGRRLYQAEIDYVFENNRTAAVAAGLEIHLVPGSLDLRVGVSREVIGVNRTLPSAGAGILVGGLRLDYAFVSESGDGLDPRHRFALGASF